MTDERQPTSAASQGESLPEPDHPAWQMANVFPETGWGEQAWLRHQRELPRLLETERGKWVAYHGGNCLGIASTHLRLYDEWVARGVAPEELVICQIEPIEEQQSWGMGVCRVDENPLSHP
jgi:hypothetical protein